MVIPGTSEYRQKKVVIRRVELGPGVSPQDGGVPNGDG